MVSRVDRVEVHCLSRWLWGGVHCSYPLNQILPHTFFYVSSTQCDDLAVNFCFNNSKVRLWATVTLKCLDLPIYIYLDLDLMQNGLRHPPLSPPPSQGARKRLVRALCDVPKVRRRRIPTAYCS